MSYHPKRGFHRDAAGTVRFDVEASLPTGSTKRWYRGRVTRVALDGKGEVVRRNTQETSVYARGEEVAAYLVARCPTPWVGQGDAEVRTKVYFWPQGEEESL